MVAAKIWRSLHLVQESSVLNRFNDGECLFACVDFCLRRLRGVSVEKERIMEVSSFNGVQKFFNSVSLKSEISLGYFDKGFWSLFQGSRPQRRSNLNLRHRSFRSTGLAHCFLIRGSAKTLYGVSEIWTHSVVWYFDSRSVECYDPYAEHMSVRDRERYSLLPYSDISNQASASQGLVFL